MPPTTISTNPRSMLFVSGERAERFPKAIEAGADVVCIDLEDAVHPDRKNDARSTVISWLESNAAEHRSCGLALRINGVRTADGQRDLAAIARSSMQLDWLLVPKVEDASDLALLASAAGARFKGSVALLETARGVEAAASIAASGGNLQALMLGGADLAADLGAQFGWDGLLYARGRLVNAAKAFGLQAWDVPHIDLKALDALVEETRRVLALGFTCKTAIHPSQVAPIHSAFAPSAAELAWATALLAALPDDGHAGAFLFEGRMVDAPVIRKARRIAELGQLISR